MVYNKKVVKNFSNKHFSILRMNKLQKNKKTGGDNNLSLLSLAWELGYIIAIPIVVLAVGGAMLDRKIGTSPWILLGGVGSSIVITSYMVYSKVTTILNDFDKKEKVKDKK